MRRLVCLFSTFAILMVACTGAAALGTLKLQQPKSDNKAPNKSDEDRSAAIVVYQQPAAIKRVEPDEPVRVVFSGLTAFEESDVLKAFHEQHASFPQKQMPETEALNKAASILEGMLQAQGYPKASVTGMPDPEAHCVRFVVDEGQRLPVTEIRFTGNRVFSAERLNAKMSDCLSQHKENGPGYNRQILEWCRHDLLAHIRSVGYLQANFGEAKPQIIPQGLRLTMPLTEGALYRLGELKIEGMETATQEQLRSVLPLARGDVVDGTKLGRWAYEDLKKLYGNLGYVEYTAEIDPEFKTLKGHPHEGVVDLKITIDEGKRFRLGSIEFAGDNLAQPELRRLFAMNDGDVYSQERFQEGIKKLNHLGLFDLIDADADSEYKVDEEQALVTIVIKVRKSTAQNQ
jgi:outer membrane protein insertion porin family